MDTAILMEEQEKARLRQKRLDLKKRHDLEGQWARLNELLAVFDGKGVAYEKLYPLTIDEVASSGASDPYTQWLENHFRWVLPVSIGPVSMASSDVKSPPVFDDQQACQSLP